MGSRHRRRLTALVPRASICALLAITLANPGRGRAYSKELQALLSREGRPVTIMSLATDLSPGFPAILDTPHEWGSRFQSMWTVPGSWKIIVDSRNTPAEIDAAGRILRWTEESVAEDIDCNRPDFVLVDISAPPRFLGGTDFRFLDWLNESTPLRASWSAYVPWARIEAIGVFRRTPTTTACGRPTVPWLRATLPAE